MDPFDHHHSIGAMASLMNAAAQRRLSEYFDRIGTLLGRAMAINQAASNSINRPARQRNTTAWACEIAGGVTSSRATYSDGILCSTSRCIVSK
jgi:hypothetical protein